MREELSDGRELTVRPAEPDDARPLAELWAGAFPGERTAGERVRALEKGRPFGGLETCRVGEVAGRVAGAYRAYSFQMNLFGGRYPTLGLGAVAVAPDFRRRGVGAALCRRALQEGKDRGDVLALLYPFRASYYARLGFTLVGELHRYRFPPDDLPLFRRWEEVQRMEPAHRMDARELYERAAGRSNGLLDRTDAMWESVWAGDPEACVVLGEDGLAGYLLAEPRGLRSRDGPRLQVTELVSDDPSAYRALLGWLSAQRGQWREVTYDALPGEQFHRLLGHPQSPRTRNVRGLWFESARILRGPMARMLDVAAALGERGPGNGHAIPVADPLFPENSGIWEGRPEGVRRVQGGSAGGEEPEGGLPISLVTELFLSGTLPGQLERLGDWTPALGFRDFRILTQF